MMRGRFGAAAVLFAALSVVGCGEVPPRDEVSRILVVGDSALSWHRISGRSVGGVLQDMTGRDVVDRSVAGARFNYALPITGAMGLNISKQYISGLWSWVVINGGGNDIFIGCGCIACDYTLNRLISEDGRRGKIPALVQRARVEGARVILVGYLHSPGVGSIIDHCKDEDVELQRRIAKLADMDEGTFYVKSSEIVSYGDMSYHATDMVHPSVKGSAEIARRIAQIILAN